MLSRRLNFFFDKLLHEAFQMLSRQIPAGIVEVKFLVFIHGIKGLNAAAIHNFFALKYTIVYCVAGLASGSRENDWFTLALTALSCSCFRRLLLCTRNIRGLHRDSGLRRR